jgi:hypothetical protein
MSTLVELDRFGCTCGGGLRKLPKYLMGYVGHVVVVKWVVKFVHYELRGWVRNPGVLCLSQIHWVMQ